MLQLQNSKHAYCFQGISFFGWGVTVGPHGTRYFGAGSQNMHWGEVADIALEQNWQIMLWGEIRDAGCPGSE